jgi:Tfp pilus assembly protein PilN
MRNVSGSKLAFTWFRNSKHAYDCDVSVNLLQEIAGLEVELQEKDTLLEKQNKLLQHWQGLLEAQKKIHIQELERV